MCVISSHLIHSRMIRYPVINYVFVFVSICACMCDDGSWIWRSKLRRMHGRHAPNSMSADREQLSLHPCRCHRCLMNSCSSAAQVRNAIRLRFSRAHMYYGRRYSYALELLHFVITIATRIINVEFLKRNQCSTRIMQTHTHTLDDGRNKQTVLPQKPEKPNKFRIRIRKMDMYFTGAGDLHAALLLVTLRTMSTTDIPN